MSISITIDKSTFQSLNSSELEKLTDYYKHNIAPILVMEIIGDLKKEAVEGKKQPDEIVTDFATKLFPYKSIVNSYYRNLVIGELTGKEVTFDGRPHADVEKIVASDDGKKGFVLKETEEEKSIHKWRSGNFSEADKELSKIWRTNTTEENLLKNLQQILKTRKEGEKIRSLNELNEKVEGLLNDIYRQEGFLNYLLINYGEGEIDGLKTLRKWNELGRPLLSEFAKYSRHCLKVDLLFHFGLMHELIGTRPTNRVDLEYLYYLPFCNVFTSNDKIHKQLTPLLLRPDQKFITGEELKGDLRNIVNFLDDGGMEFRKIHKSKPPIITDSFTFQIWQNFYNYPNRNRLSEKLSDAKLEDVKNQMDKFIKASEGEAVNFSPGEEENFIVKKSYLSMKDFCYCGSGKIIIDCCIPEEKFKQMTRNL